jgi:hypothetical protein
MSALLGSLLVGGLAIAIAGATLPGRVAAAAALGITSVTFDQNPVNEGATLRVDVVFTDLDTNGAHTGVIAWGDGRESQTTTMQKVGVGVWTFFLTHSYADDNPTGTPQDVVALTVTVTNGIDLPVTATPTPPLVVRNVAPRNLVLTGLPAVPIVAGQTVNASIAWDDPSLTDTFTVIFDWGDTVKDTSPLLGSSFRTFNGSHTYAGGGTFNVVVTVRDDDTGEGTATGQVVVIGVNHPPTSFVPTVTPTNEGGTATLGGSFTDADVLDTHVLSILWGDTSAAEPFTLAAGVVSFGPPALTVAPTHVYANPGSYTISVRLTDSASTFADASVPLTVSNVLPAVSSLTLSPTALVEGDTLNLSGLISDPGPNDTFTLGIDWGDGSLHSAPAVAPDRTFAASHQYVKTGLLTLTLTVTDRDGGIGTRTATVDVKLRNRPPAGLVLTATGAVEGASAALSGTFTDPDLGDTHTASIDWGDGTTSSVPATGGSFSTSHVYAHASKYAVSVKVSDQLGASTTAQAEIVVTARSRTVAELLDDLAALVRSYHLDPSLERVALERISEAKASLTEPGHEGCDELASLDRGIEWLDRHGQISSEQAASLKAITAQIRAQVSCTGSGGHDDGNMTKALRVSERVAHHHNNDRHDRDSGQGEREDRDS